MKKSQLILSGKILKVLGKIILILLAFSFLGTWEPNKLPKQVLAEQNLQSGIQYDDFHLIIPKLNLQAPIIADVDGQNKKIYFKALENGVAHFKGTAKPGEGSNIFIFGHSSFYPWSPGDYKEIFRSLENLQENDEIIIWHQKKEYKYYVFETKVVDPDEVKFLKPTTQEQVTLMTCVPPGTTLKRLIIIGKPK